MSGGGETTRVSIPDNVQSTIQNIREITKKLHSDDEIYAVLKECSMDPNETAQKLLYLDTFHEVKKRRDRKKENLKGRASEESRTTPGAHRRMVRGGGQGNYSSDAGGGRNSTARRENGGGHVADGGSLSSVMPVQQKAKNNAAAPIAKASISVPNGVKNMSNGISSPVSASKSSAGADANKVGATAQRYAVVVASSPVVGLRDQRRAPTPTPEQLPVPANSAADSGVYSAASDSSSTLIQVNKDISGDSVVLELSKSDNVASKSDNPMIKEKTRSNKAKAVGKNRPAKLSESPSSTHDGSQAILPSNSDGESQPESTNASKVATLEFETIAVEAASQLPPDSSLSDIKLVTFPNHIKVPESLRSVLTFGSINSTFGTSAGMGGHGSAGDTESSQDTDEAAKEPSPRLMSNVSAASSVQGDLSENPLPSANVLEKLQPSEGSVSSIPDSDSKSELLKQDLQLPPEVPHSLTALNGPSYNLGFLPPMLGNQVLQVEGHDNQAHEASRVSNFGGNSVGVPSPNTTPPLPNSIASSPQIPVFRHTYPANYFPYGYMPPYYLPPMHQFLSPNGYPPQPLAYLPPTAPAAAGIKYPPQFKAGSNAPNPAQYNIQSGGSFITTPTGYAPGPAVTSGSSAGNTDDLGASQLKESHIYTTGQLTEGQTVWFHTPGQDISSLYNLPQGQRFAFSPVHAGHGAMAGIYPPGQTMASPTYLQQSQAVAGAAETIGPPPAAYQQPQHAQMNWSSSF